MSLRPYCKDGNARFTTVSLKIRKVFFSVSCFFKQKICKSLSQITRKCRSKQFEETKTVIYLIYTVVIVNRTSPSLQSFENTLKFPLRMRKFKQSLNKEGNLIFNYLRQFKNLGICSEVSFLIFIRQLCPKYLNSSKSQFK